MPYIETSDKVPLYYVDEGPRSPSAIFLAHASPLSSRFWQKNIPVLSRQFRVVAMDTRGRGESGKTEDGLTVAQFARDMRHVLAALGLDRVLAIGWSFSSTVVLNYMEQFGDDRLAGYINVDQPPFWRGPADRLRTLIADLPPARRDGSGIGFCSSWALNSSWTTTRCDGWWMSV